jgi:hypothetical protein
VNLLLRLGIAPAAAFIAALAYGFGWQGTPGRLHILQSQHVWLPLMALALHRLRERPAAGPTLVAALVTAAALLSSYHMAVYAGVGAAIWGLAELARGGPARGRYLGAAALAGASAVAVLVVVSLPYLARPEARGEVELVFSRRRRATRARGRRLHADCRSSRGRISAARSAGRLSCVPIDWLAERLWALVRAGALAPFTPSAAAAARRHGGRGAVPDAARHRRPASRSCWRLVLYGPESVDVGGTRAVTADVDRGQPGRFIRVCSGRSCCRSSAPGSSPRGLDWLLARVRAPFRAPSPVLTLAVRCACRRGRAADADCWRGGAPRRAMARQRRPRCRRRAPPRRARVEAGGGCYRLARDRRRRGGLGQTIHRQPSVNFTGYLPPHVSDRAGAGRRAADGRARRPRRYDGSADRPPPEREWKDAYAFRRMRRPRAASARGHARGWGLPRARSRSDVASSGGTARLRRDGCAASPRSVRRSQLQPSSGRAVSTAGVRPAQAGKPIDVRVLVANDGTQGWPAALPAADAPLGVVLDLRWTPDASVARSDGTCRRAKRSRRSSRRRRRSGGRLPPEVVVRQVGAGDWRPPASWVNVRLKPSGPDDNFIDTGAAVLAARSIDVRPRPGEPCVQRCRRPCPDPSLGHATDANLDPSFGTYGWTTVAGGPGFDQGHDVAIQADGAIVVVDSGEVVRLTPAGALDATFGVGGIAGGPAGVAAHAVAIQADGATWSPATRTWPSWTRRWRSIG